MFRVVLVDDEPLVRIGLRELVAWNEHGCEVIAEAADGGEALRLLEQQAAIDLIVIDILMPEMGGIEFLKRLSEREMPSKPLVVVLSAFPEYEYVRQAFLLGAVDYIVKATMEPELMNAVIRKTVALLKERLQRDDLLLKEEQAEQLKLREQALANLLKGEEGTELQALASDKDWLKWLRDAGNAEQALACVAMDEYSGEETEVPLDEKTSRFILHTIRQAAGENPQIEAHALPINETEYALLLMFRHSASHGRHRMRNQLAEIIDRVVSHLKQYLNLSVSIGVSDFVRGSPGWKDRYIQARELARLRFYEHDRTVWYPEHGAITSEEVKLQTEPWDRKPLLRNLATGESWEVEMAKGFRYWRSFRTRPHSEFLQMLRTFLWEIGALLNAHNLDWEAISEKDSTPHEKLQQMNRLADIQKWMSGLLGKIASRLDPRRRAADSSPRLTDKAKKYIHDHYHEPISLTQISEWVGVTESHLSKQFAKETGDNFISYLTNLRIQKAIELMRGGMKLFEIAERVGYPNPEHFSRNFKKVTGRTPQQYREEIKP